MYPTSEWLTEMRGIWGKTGQMIGIGTYGCEDNVALGESGRLAFRFTHLAAKPRMNFAPVSLSASGGLGSHTFHSKRGKGSGGPPEQKPCLDAEIRRLRIDALELEYEHGQLAL